MYHNKTLTCHTTQLSNQIVPGAFLLLQFDATKFILHTVTCHTLVPYLNQPTRNQVENKQPR
jgi:hypothetical protein